MKISRWLLTLLMILGSAAMAWGSPLLFIGYNESPPFSYEENGRVIGIDVDIVKELARRLKLDIVVELYPWKRLIYMTQNGQCDGSFSLFLTPEQQKIALFALNQPIHESIFSLFVKKGHEFKFENLDDLTGKRIGIDLGFTVNEDFDARVRDGRIILHETPDEEINILMLMAGRIDAFANTYAVTLYKLLHEERLRGFWNQLTALPRPLVDPVSKAYLVLSKKGRRVQDKPGLIRQINQTLETMQADGAISAINHDYLAPMDEN